jgi:ABC-type nitrate/sulfonate/bicarbonate transport system ATPase subunit
VNLSIHKWSQMDTSRELLRVEGLSKTFSSANNIKTVLTELNFTLASHDSLSIVGPSGCGKTTLLLMIAGLLPATRGSIRLDGTAIKDPTTKIALVLQQYGLFPWKTVAANILLGAQLQKIAVNNKELRGLKEELGIEELDHLYPQQLSGGQRQRVALARAILLQPYLLLLDEPFAAVDTIARERLQNGLASLFTRRKFSFVIVTHNIEEAVFLGRRIMVLDNGANSMRAIIDNPHAGRRDYRTSALFFEKSLALRRILEDLE